MFRTAFLMAQHPILTGRFTKKLTIGFLTFPINISLYSHIITIPNTYMIISIQLAIIQAFTAH